MHTSLRLHPATIAWNCWRPFLNVIGPGGLEEGYPSQPPSFAMIQAAQRRLAFGLGFFWSDVLPSSLELRPSSKAISSVVNAIEAGSEEGPLRAWSSCWVVMAVLVAMAAKVNR